MHIIFQYIGKADVYSDKLSEQVTNQVVLYWSLRSVCCQNFSTFPLDIKSLHFVYATSKITTKFCFLDSFYLLMSNCIFQIVCLLHQISSNSCLREIMQRERFTTEPETRSWNNFIGQIIVVIKQMLKPDLSNLLLFAIYFFPSFIVFLEWCTEITKPYYKDFFSFLKINPSDNPSQ